VVIEGPSGDPVVLTAPAFRLHVFSLAASFARGVPGFIPDAYLDAVDVESTAATAELCRHGLWTRRDGGYDVQDRLLVEAAAHVQQRMSDAEIRCLRRGGHTPANSDVCSPCCTPLPPDARG
jgi:hypothetical protein